MTSEERKELGGCVTNQNNIMEDQNMENTRPALFNEDDNLRQLPKYKSHKEVWALKIKEVVSVSDSGYKTETDGSAVLHFEEEGYAPIKVNYEYVRKHSPLPGGYYVVYEDGYKSWSPAEAFEEGYSRIEQ